MRAATSVPFEDGSGAVVLAVAGWWRLRVRTVTVVHADAGGRRGVTSRRRLLRFAAALDVGALPVRVPGVRAVVDDDPMASLPYVLVRCPGTPDVRVALSSLAAAARSAAGG